MTDDAIVPTLTAAGMPVETANALADQYSLIVVANPDGSESDFPRNPDDAWALILADPATAPYLSKLTGGTTVPDFVIGPGFKAEITKRGWHAASDEDYFAQTANAKVSVCVCEEGILWYSSASNKVGATPFS